MAVLNTDQVLWYNVGKFGDLGYAVPNPSNDFGSLNPSIADVVHLAGRNLFAIMHHQDADLSVPPSINTVRRIHQLYVRLANVLSAAGVPPNEMNFEASHLQPAGEVFLVYPIPYFLVRNKYMQRWAGLILMMISEAMQHTENRKCIEISTTFTGDIGKFMARLYRNLATDLFGKTRDEVRKEGFILTEVDLAGYNPAEWHTRVEMIDTVPNLGNVFTEDQLEFLSDGILVTDLPELTPWPTNLQGEYAKLRQQRSAGASDINVDDPNTSASASAGGVVMPEN